MTVIEGGITAPAGFRAAGVHCGIKASGGLDLALVVADGPSSAAGLFTTNLAQAAPVLLCRQYLEQTSGVARAIVVNSGCANACTGADGMDVARGMARETARVVGCPAEQVLVASTGVIGVSLDPVKVSAGIGAAASALSRDAGHDAARAIMTTDPWPKERAVAVNAPSGRFHVGGMAKGSGMIEPMLATMLGFVTTDVAIEPALLRRAIVDAAETTFNAITVDGECSTNDAVLAMASGASKVRIDQSNLAVFIDALRDVCGYLALEIVRGGEGATKLVTVRVTGAASYADARRAAREIANSPLVKTALHGGDPNWGRLIAVAGRAGVEFDLDHAEVRIGPITLFADGRPFDERAGDAAKYLEGRTLTVAVDLGVKGPHQADIYTCDFSAEYVRINAEYRT
jgi:glutamate N-acetyltransferase/amino-acid N-acetyltransferase